MRDNVPQRHSCVALNALELLQENCVWEDCSCWKTKALLLMATEVGWLRLVDPEAHLPHNNRALHHSNTCQHSGGIVAA
jgi:hypothetical protein